MSAPAANLSVWVGEKVVVIKIAGRASFTSSVDFKTLVYTLRGKGQSRFILDLSECLLMDSTFLGVLAGMGLKFNDTPNGENHASIELLQPNERISDLLENLGVVHLFKVLKASAACRENLTAVTPTARQADPTEVTRTCLEAHQTLMELNPANIPKFKDVAQFLAEDLKRKEK